MEKAVDETIVHAIKTLAPRFIQLHHGGARDELRDQVLRCLKKTEGLAGWRHIQRTTLASLLRFGFKANQDENMRNFKASSDILASFYDINRDDVAPSVFQVEVQMDKEWTEVIFRDKEALKCAQSFGRHGILEPAVKVERKCRLTDQDTSIIYNKGTSVFVASLTREYEREAREE